MAPRAMERGGAVGGMPAGAALGVSAGRGALGKLEFPPLPMLRPEEPPLAVEDGLKITSVGSWTEVGVHGGEEDTRMS